MFGALRLPRSILFGRGQRHAIGSATAKIGKRALLCTDPRQGAQPEFKAILDDLERSASLPTGGKSRGSAKASRADQLGLFAQLPAPSPALDMLRQIDVDQYRYGFETVIESDKAPKGLSEDTVRFISAKKNEPGWMLEWRLGASVPTHVH